MNVLIVEDDILVAEMMKKVIKTISVVNLVEVAHNFDEAFRKYMSKTFDLVLADIHLVGDRYDGIDLCKLIRQKDSKIPLLIISSDTSLESLEKAFNIHISDYIKKPFYPKELLLRVKHWLRQSHYIEFTKKIHYKKMIYNSKNNEFFYANQKIPLTKKSKALLLLFIKNPENLLTQQFLKEKLWGDYDHLGTNRNLRSNIQILRATLNKVGCSDWLSTIRGEGYILKKN